jgi:uncharacterized protein (TIGR03067 family)
MSLFSSARRRGPAGDYSTSGQKGDAMSRSLIVLSISVCVATLVRADEKSDKALKELQGDWKVEKMVREGEAAPPEKIAKLVLTFKGNQIIPSEKPTDIATITLDPSQKPAAIDLMDERGKEMNFGIYELKGDTLKICLAQPKAARPKEFGSTKESMTMYFELKRAAK